VRRSASAGLRMAFAGAACKGDLLRCSIFFPYPGERGIFATVLVRRCPTSPAKRFPPATTDISLNCNILANFALFSLRFISKIGYHAANN
jgi:hypothetical protein